MWRCTACAKQRNWTFCADRRAPKACETCSRRNTSMATDKKDYQSVLSALVDYGTLASIINKLNRVLIATEDTRL